MPTYGNIDGASREIKPWYANVGGAQKAQSNIYTNINGVQKTIYSAEKYHWWRRYDANAWISKSFIVDVGSESLGWGWGYFDVDMWNSYTYSSYSFNSNTGLFTLSDASKLTWTENVSATGIDYILNSSHVNTYTIDPFMLSISNISTHAIYKLEAGWGRQEETSEEYVVHIPTGLYALPNGHSSSYTLIKGVSANYPYGQPPTWDGGYYYSPDDNIYYYCEYDGYY